MTGVRAPGAIQNANGVASVAGRRRRIPLAVAVTPLMRWLVARYAVPVGEPWRRACDRCDLPFPPASSGWSAFLPAARCSGCGGRVGAPPYVIEALLVIALVVAVWAAPTAAITVAALWWLACAVVLLFVDLRVHRLPDALTNAATVGVLVCLVVDAAVTGSTDGLLRAALTAAGYGVAFLLVALVLGRRGIGLGDVKLVVSLAALLGWWGPGAVFAAVFVAFVGSGLVGAVLLGTRRVSRGSHIPMAPFFVIGTLVVLALLGWTAN